jgi:HTH-type transcriptional regulator/antitoxin HigA
MKPADIKPIRTDADYQNALSTIEKLFGAAPDTEDGQTLDVLLVLVEDWERKQGFELPQPDPVTAIKFRMEQQGLTKRDLVPYIGSLSKVSEVLSGKAPLSLSMIRSLSKNLGIPADILLIDPLVSVSPEAEALCEQAHRLPLKEMVKRQWIVTNNNLKTQAEEIFRAWIKPLEPYHLPAGVFPRESRNGRYTDKNDRMALFAWCTQVLLRAKKESVSNRYTPGSITNEFLRELSKLSMLAEGPKLAKKMLAEKGVRLIIESHLPKTYLDGALLSLGGEPVIGMTLRYDRVDNFWFTLFHELGHLMHDFDTQEDAVFTDDMTLDSESGAYGESEKRADRTALDALIDSQNWEIAIPPGAVPSTRRVIELAFQWQINPAIIAGRLRHQTKNYRLYPDLVFTGEIRPLFESQSA